MFPPASPPEEVETWVTSQWKFMPLVGQIQVVINSQSPFWMPIDNQVLMRIVKRYEPYGIQLVTQKLAVQHFDKSIGDRIVWS